MASVLSASYLNWALKLIMTIRHTIILTLCLFFSQAAFSCKNEQDEFLELSIDSSQYVTKPDTSRPAKPSFFNKKGKHPSLYCSTRSGSKCGKDSTWFTSEEFAKYLVSYKPVNCHQIVSTMKVQSGVKISATSFKVYYSNK